MSPAPQPGIYTDNCDTRYHATRNAKTGWWVQKLPPGPGAPPEPFQKPDFEAACHAGFFTFHSPNHASI